MTSFPLAQLGVIIDFSDGSTFITTAMTLNSSTLGKLDTGQLADSATRADLSANVVSCSIRRGRNRILDQFQAGTATVVVNDPTGDLNPMNVSGAYYGKLVPLRKILIYAKYLGTQYPLFYGYINTYTTNFATGVNSVSQVTLQCTDGMRLINNAVISSVPASAAGDNTSTRITQILDLISWPSSLRSLDTGSSTCQIDPGTANRSALDALQVIADKTEFGGLFLSTTGQVKFYSRNNIALRAAQPQAYFDDQGSNTDYQSIQLMHDDVMIVNDVRVNRLGGAVQSVSDATSISTYFTHSGVRANNLVETDAEALSQAQTLLAARKDATLRISSLGLNLFDTTLAGVGRNITAFSTDIFTPIEVRKTMPGGSVFDEILLVQGINYDITKKSFVCTLMTAEPIIKAFVLDHGSLGVLDSTNGLLTY